MAFRFSLSALLRLRSTLERMQENRLTCLRQEARLLETSIEQTISARHNIKISATPSLVAPSSSPPAEYPTGADFQFVRFQQEQLAWREQQLQLQLDEKRLQIHVQALAFAQARRQRQVLESLRDRELALYEEEERRRDQRQLDDTFLLQLMRKRALLRG